MPVGPATPESEQLERIANELARVATAHEKIATDFTRWVDSQVGRDAAETALLQVQTELAQKSLEIMNQQTTPPSPALPAPGSTAGGQVPGVGNPG